MIPARASGKFVPILGLLALAVPSAAKVEQEGGAAALHLESVRAQIGCETSQSIYVHQDSPELEFNALLSLVLLSPPASLHSNFDPLFASLVRARSNEGGNFHVCLQPRN